MESGNKLFRKEALERLSSPERLDELLKVVQPQAWIPLATLGSLAAIGLGWSLFGRLPLTVTGQGVLIQPRQVVQFQAPSEGQVTSIDIKPGDTVKKGQVLGTIGQAALEQQLQQERDKLTELLRQNQETNQIQKNRVGLDQNNLKQQKASLQESLRRAEIELELRDKNLKLLAQNRTNLENSLNSFQGLVPELRQKNLSSLTQNRESLNRNLTEIKNLLPVLRERIESRRRLLEQELITGDTLLSAEQEYFDSLSRLSELENRLKQLDVEETNTQGQYLQNLNQIDEIKSNIQKVDVEAANVQRQYLQSLNQIDEIKSKIKQIDIDQTKVAQEDLNQSIDKNNRVLEVKNRIAQLESELKGKSRIVSKYDGRVLEVTMVPGQTVAAASRIGSIETKADDSQLVSVAYFADKDGKNIEIGDRVQVTPSIVKRERYGGIVGEVTDVSPFPVTIEDMTTIIGSQNVAQSLSENLNRSGSQANVQIFARLKTNPDTPNGYEWSSSDGPPLKLSSGTTTIVRVKVGEVAPISYVIPLLRSLTGVY